LLGDRFFGTEDAGEESENKPKGIDTRGKRSRKEKPEKFNYKATGISGGRKDEPVSGRSSRAPFHIMRGKEGVTIGL